MATKTEEPIGLESGSAAPNTAVKDDAGTSLKLHDKMNKNGVAIALSARWDGAPSARSRSDSSMRFVIRLKRPGGPLFPSPTMNRKSCRFFGRNPV